MARKKSVANRPAAKKPYTPPVATKAITEFTWRGQTRFKCSKCKFDTNSEAEAYSHYQQNHVVPKPKIREVDTGLVGPGGDKIVKVEEVHDGEDTANAD